MKHALGSLIVLPVLLVGCNQPNTADLEADLCNNLNQLGTSLQELGQLNAQSQVKDLRQARENVAKSYQAVRASAEAVQSSRLTDLQTAYDDLDKTINNVSGRQTLGEAATQVGAGLANVQAAQAQVNAELNCP